VAAGRLLRVGIVLIVLGIVLFFSWDGGYGYGHWRGPR
jgi:uncharacterized membrane protein